MSTLPSFFFSYQYLKNLAAVSKKMLEAVRSKDNWRDRTVSLSTSEFEDPFKLRAMVAMYASTLKVRLNVRQLSMLRILPERLLLEWKHVDVCHDRTGNDATVIGYQSQGPLAGCAAFNLELPAAVQCIYIGVREWHVDKTAFCRIENLFREDAVISWSLAQNIPPLPHAGKEVRLQPNRAHRIDIMWDQRFFQLSLDGEGLSRARALPGSPEAPAPLSQVFLWIHADSPTDRQMITFEPLPSMVQLSARITCALCQRQAGLTRPDWAVCPLCDSWICNDHIRRKPLRKCPNCPNQLFDYVGGSSALKPHVDTTAFYSVSGSSPEAPYLNAVAFFYNREDFRDGDDKFACVVLKVMREHLQFLRRFPLALELLPDPRCRPSMSKRMWERILFRARVIIALLDQKRYYILFFFLQEVAQSLEMKADNSLQRLPHPKEYDGSEDEWGTLALRHSLRLHLALASQQRRRSSKLQLHGQDVSGGAAPAHSEIVSAMLPPEILDLILPQSYFSFEFLSCLAACSREFFNKVADESSWEQLDIDLNVPEFKHDLVLLRRMSRLWTVAHTVRMTQSQLAFCGPPSLSNLLIHWEAERIPFWGQRSCGYISTQTLLGCATFHIVVPEEARTITFGVKSPTGRRRLYLDIKEAFTERMCIVFGVSGASQDLRPRVFPKKVLLPEICNEVMMIWNSRSFGLKINGYCFGPIQVRPDLPSGPDSQGLPYVWVTNSARMQKRPELEIYTSDTPVLPNARCLCLVCGLEASIREQEWRVCPECNTWICKDHTDTHPGMQCPGCSLLLADYVGGATTTRTRSHVFPGQSLPFEMVLSLHSYFFAHVAGPHSHRSQPAKLLLKPLDIALADTKFSKGSDYSGGANSKFRSRQTMSFPGQQANYSLPPEILSFLPTYVFDYRYLRALATCSTAMLQAVRDKENWRGLDVVVDQPDLEDSRRLRSISNLLSFARSVHVNVSQLSMYLIIPASVKLRWETVPLPPQPHLPHLMFGFRSSCALIGFAEFDVFLPAEVTGLYIGVKDWHGDKRSYCRIDNVFRESMTLSISMNELPAQRHPSAGRLSLLQNQTNRVQICWSHRIFQIALNGSAAASARLRGAAEVDAAPPLSGVFLWAFGQTRRQGVAAEIHPLPSRIQLNASIRCGLCRRERSLLTPRWRVCPLCSTWVCAEHLGQTPWRSCPNCTLQLQDYLGGTSSCGGGCDVFIELRRSSEASSPRLNPIHVCFQEPVASSQDLQGGSTLSSHTRQRIEQGRAAAKARQAFHKKWRQSSAPCQGSSLRIDLTGSAPLCNLDVTFESFAASPRLDVSFVYLQRCHPHPRDEGVVFFPDTHVYLIDGHPSLSSVTAVIHSYSNPFQADDVIRRMMAGPNWPRAEYSRYEAGQLLPLTSSQIKAKWKQNAEEAALLGTWTHLKIECLLNGGRLLEYGLEMDLFFRFLQNHSQKLMAYRTEWCIWGTEERLAGCIDFAAMNSQGHLVLFDWKRSKNLRHKYANPWQTMRGCLAHLPDCAGVHYRLQLNIYAYLIEKYYSFNVAAMYVVCVHPDNTLAPFLDCVPRLCQETAALMSAQIEIAGKHSTNSSSVCDVQDELGGSVLERPHMQARLKRQPHDIQAGSPEHRSAACTQLDFNAPLHARKPHSPADYMGGASQEDGAVGSGSLQEMVVQLAEGEDQAPAALAEASQSSFAARVDAELAEEMEKVAEASCEPKEEQPEEAMAGSDLEGCLELEDATWAALRKRRLLPGAPTSDKDFEVHFGNLLRTNADFQSSCLREVFDESGAIRNMVARHKCHVSENFPHQSDRVTRLMTAVLAVLTLRTVDVFMREHAVVLWIIEGESHMRFHEGDCYILHPSNAFQQYKGMPLDCSRVHSFLMHLEGRKRPNCGFSSTQILIM